MLESIVDIVAICFLYYRFVIPHLKFKSNSTQTITTLFSIYIFCVLTITLFPILTALPFVFAPRFPRMVNIIPFIDVLEHTDGALTQVFLNILLTMPLGYLFPLFFKPSQRKFTHLLLATITLTSFIESMQWVLANGRITDVTDIITNTLGGIVGYVIYKVTRQLVLTYKKRALL